MGRLISVDQDGVSLELTLGRTLLKRMMAPSKRKLNGYDGPEAVLEGIQAAADEVGDEVEVDGGRIRITHRTVGHLSQEIADAVGLPPLVDLTFCADMTGLVGSPGFSLTYGWRHAGRREFARRTGAILETPGVGSDGLRRLPLWMLDAAEISGKIHPEDSPELHWTALAKFRRAIDPAVRAGGVGAEAKVSMTHYLGGLRIALAERFAISPTGADQFAIVPIFHGVTGVAANGDAAAIEREAGLHNGSLRQFRRVVIRRGASGVFNLGRQCHLVVEPIALPVLRVMAKMQRGSPEMRAEFVRDPRPHVLEAIAEELRERGKLEGLSPKEEEDLIEQTAKAAFVEDWDPSAGDTKPVNESRSSNESAGASDAEPVQEGPWNRAEDAPSEAGNGVELEAGGAGDVDEREDEEAADTDGAQDARGDEVGPSSDSEQDGVKLDAADDSEQPAAEAPAAESAHAASVEGGEQDERAERAGGPPSPQSIDMPEVGVGETDDEDEAPTAEEEAAADQGKPGEGRWDASQKTVIEAACNTRLIVDAGPGTGKTAVACERLAHLIRTEQLTPVNALMISFTRTAVAEIRDRLYKYVGTHAYAIRIATIDSHAWSIHSAHVPGAKLTGSSFDENIKDTTELLKTDETVKEELRRLEHVVIDEAQDIVGVRAVLVGLLAENLSENCGVTVFADNAQAIYGFSDESDGSAQDEDVKPLLERLTEIDGSNFSHLSLDQIHRTSSPSLKRIFTEVRKDVLDPKKRGKGQARQTADDIRERADKQGIEWKDVKVKDFDAETLILLRARVDVLMASQFCDEPHRLRLSGYGATLPPWLALCFHDFTEPFLEEREFLSRWSKRVGAAAEAGLDSAEAWRRIRKMAGKKGGLVDMGRLRQKLARSRPPVELATPEFGLCGPIVGTIHASKGREAPKVVLLLPLKPGAKSGNIDGEAEEARVLFVGATRAKETLSVGTGSGAVFSSDSLGSGRVFRTTRKGHIMVEVGRHGDISPKGLVGREIMDEESAIEAQEYLADAANEVTCYSLKIDSNLDYRHAIVVDSNDLRVGVMETGFKRELWNVVRMVNDSAKRRSPGTLKPVRGQGCSTMVLAPDSTDLEDLHEPWASSGFVLAPRIAAFPSFRL